MPFPINSTPASVLDPYGAFVSRCAAGVVQRGSLKGLRLCVKDNIAVAGEPFSAGHPLFAERVGLETAPAVKRLLGAGADMVGMTRSDSGGFGMTTPDVRNPRFPEWVVGGSSGGAAAAVAAGFAELGLGTDTGGDVRVPAACTSLYAYKPTFGRAPIESVWPFAPRFDDLGLIARDIATLEKAAEALVGEKFRDPRGEALPSREGRLVIGVDDAAPSFQATSVAAAFAEVVASVERAGHVVKHYALPDRAALAADFGTLTAVESATAYAGLSDADWLFLGPAAQRVLAVPSSEAALNNSRFEIERARSTYAACLADCDILLSPTLYITPPAVGTRSVEGGGRKWPLLQVLQSGTCFCNIAGAPALTIPLDRAFSLHVAARPGADASLFSSVERLLQVLDWATV